MLFPCHAHHTQPLFWIPSSLLGMVKDIGIHIPLYHISRCVVVFMWLHEEMCKMEAVNYATPQNYETKLCMIYPLCCVTVVMCFFATIFPMHHSKYGGKNNPEVGYPPGKHEKQHKKKNENERVHGGTNTKSSIYLSKISHYSASTATCD